jgi:HEAT repeat protein
MAAATHAATLAQGAPKSMFAYKMVASALLVLTAFGGGGYAILGRGGNDAPLQHQSAATSLLVMDDGGPERGFDNKVIQAPTLKKYHVGDRDLEMGFEPEQSELVFGEPLLAAFVVKNTSDKPFTYVLGGDQRGTGRHNHFKITAVDVKGSALPDPKADKDGNVPDFGGLSWLREIKAGATDRLPLDLGQFRSFTEFGVYTVTCRFDVYETHEAKKPAATVETTFRLKVLPASEENVKRVIARLVNEAGRSQKEALNNAINGLCAFAKERAVPELVTLSAKGDTEHRTAAILALGRFATTAAEAVALKALRDPEVAIQIAAASALGEIKTEAAVDALLSRLGEVNPDLASTILRALGRTRSPRALERIEKAITGEDVILRRSAAAGMAEFGGDRAIAVLKRCAADQDIGRREAVLLALEHLNQPLQPEWILPLIIAGRDYGYTNHTAPNPNEAVRLLRLYGGEGSTSALVSCIDFDNPSVRCYFSFVVFNDLAARRDAPKATWHNDPNADGTPEQIEENTKTLKRLRSWLDEQKAPGQEGDPVNKLITQLGDADIKVREEASKELEAKGTAALPLLLRAGAISEDDEVRTRARGVVERLKRRWMSQL